MHNHNLTDEEIVAMSVAAIAKQTGKDPKKMIVRSFHKVSESSLQKFLKDSNTEFNKYKLENVL